MPKFLKITASALVFAFCAASANAAPIGSIAHNYGSNAGNGAKASTVVANTCDSLNTNSITVRDNGAANCTRFLDVFDFSSMNFSNVSSLVLTLTFGQTDAWNWGFGEDWKARGAAAASFSNSNDLLNMTNVDGNTTQTFTFNAQSDDFSAMVANKKFYLAFADQSWAENEFLLRNATLAVNGTAAVPEPTSIALFGLALAGLAFTRRRA